MDRRRFLALTLPFLVTAACNLVLAQRLARKICTDCKVDTEVDHEVLRDIGFTPEQIAQGGLKRGSGCRTCSDSGYKGRIALYEVMPLTDKLKEMVLQGCSAAELKQQMILDKILTLRMAAINKTLDGVTTVDEVLRCTVSDRS